MFSKNERRYRIVKIIGLVCFVLLVIVASTIQAAEPTDNVSVQESIIPVAGVIVPYAGETIPVGWLLCDGRSLERAAYPELFAAIGTLYGEGDTPGQTFQLPDYRGNFLRGLGGSSASLGTLQEDAAAPPNTPFVTDYEPDHIHSFLVEGLNGSPDNRILTGQRSHATFITGGGGEHDHGILGGDSETRPINMAVNWIISTGVESVTYVGAALVTAYPGETVPVGWLLCDGRSLERAAYPELFAAIGTLYGEGDTPGQTFQLPDYRGNFLRGLGGSSASLGTLQEDATAPPNTPFVTDYEPAHDHGFYVEGTNGPTETVILTGSRQHNGFATKDAGGHNHGILGGDSETRPVNMAVNWIISTEVNSSIQTLVTAYAGVAMPDDWLVCDGRSLERAAYPELFAAIGTLYGEGDTPGQTFQLPDYRGNFLRGLGGSSAPLGTLQEDATAPPNTPFVTDGEPDHNHGFYVEGTNDGTAERPLVGWRQQTSYTTGGGGGHDHSILGGDSETRPVNMAVNWIISTGIEPPTPTPTPTDTPTPLPTGTPTPPSPTCNLDVQASYSQGQLHLIYDFSTGSSPVTWHSAISIFGVWHTPFEADLPAGVSSTMTADVPFASRGTIVVATTFSTPDEGIICYDSELVDTGTADMSAPLPTSDVWQRIMERALR